jgi:hypothetical protein
LLCGKNGFLPQLWFYEIPVQSDSQLCCPDDDLRCFGSIEREDQSSELTYQARPQSAMESRNNNEFQPDWSFETLISIFVDVEKASPVELRNMINTIGPVLSRLAHADQLLFSSLLKDKLMKRLEEVHELHQRVQLLCKSSLPFLPFSRQFSSKKAFVLYKTFSIKGLRKGGRSIPFWIPYKYNMIANVLSSCLFI